MLRSRHLCKLAAATLAVLCAAAPGASAAPADLDGSWAGDGVFTSGVADLQPEDVAVAPDGRVTLAATTYATSYVLRFLASGEPDPSFGGGDGIATMDLAPGSYEAPVGVALLPDGRTLLTGIASVGAADMRVAVARLTPAGDPDPQLDGDGDADGKVLIDLPGSREAVADPVVLRDGRFWTGGTIRDKAGNDQTLFARFTSSGALDTTYEGTGYRVVSKPGQQQWNGYGLARTSDGGLLAAGDAWDGVRTSGALTKLTAAGQPDPAFGDGAGRTLVDPPGDHLGFEDAVADASGRIFAAGYRKDAGDAEAIVMRFTAAGAPDPGFGPGAARVAGVPGTSDDGFRSIALDPQGRVVAAGGVREGDVQRILIARFAADGTPDAAFGDGGVRVIDVPESVREQAFTLAVQPDARILAGVSGDLKSGGWRVSVLRLVGQDPALPAGSGSEGGSGGGSDAPATGPAPVTAARDVVAPTVTGASLLRRRFTVGGERTAISARRRRLARGTVLRFAASEASTATITIVQSRRGRRQGNRCVAGRRSGLRCVRLTTAGTLTRRITAPGVVQTPFSGRIGSRALRPGTYRAVVVLTDAAGNRSRPVTLNFRVVR